MTLSVNQLPDSPEREGNCNASRLIAAQLLNEVGKTRFETWFGDASCFSVVNGCVRITAPHNFALQRLQNNFKTEVRQAVDRVCGPQYTIAYVEEMTCPEPSVSLPSFSSASSPPKTSASSTPSRPVLQNQRRAKGIDSFWFGEENRLASTSVEQMFAQLGQFSPLFIYGPTGSGKTHLLESISNDVRKRLRRQRCIFLSAEQFTNYFVQALRGGTGLPVFRRKYRDLDLLAIDDIQFLAGKKATIAEFQFTIDNLNRMGKQVVLSSDRPPVELSNLSPDLTARLTSGLICPLRYPGFEGRMKITKQICSERNFSIPEDVLELVCEQLKNDVRRLSGAANRLHAARVATGRQVTIEVASRILGDLFAVTGATTSLLSIEKAVCEFCQIKPNELKSASRKKRICTARMLAMYLSRQYTSSAFSEIGDYYGGRSHSTVIAAQKKVNNWLVSNQEISLPHAAYEAKELVKRIELNLRIG